MTPAADPAGAPEVGGLARRPGAGLRPPLTGRVLPAVPVEPLPDLMDLLELLEGWRLSLRSEHTRAAYARDFTDWLTFCDATGLDVLRSPRRAHVDAWVGELRSRVVHGKPLAEATIGRRLSAVSSFYGYVVIEGPDLLGRARYAALELIDHNPAGNVKRPDVSATPKGRGLNKQEFQAILAAARRAGHRDAAVLHLLALSGLRVSSVCAADLSDLGHQGRHRILTYRLKGTRTEQAALAPVTLTEIDGHLADRHAGRHPELLVPGSPRPLVLAGDGTRLNRQQVGRIVARLARAAGIADPRKITPHSGRRGFVTNARKAGATPEQVQDAVDHKDPRTTRRYQQADDRFEHAPTYLLQDYLDQRPPGPTAPRDAPASVPESPAPTDGPAAAPASDPGPVRGASARAAADRDPAAVGTVHQLKISLLDVEPLVWRRLHVPSAVTLAGLAPLIEAAMGWEPGHHPHRYNCGWEFEENGDETAVLGELYPRPGGQMGYTYDFGDDWGHLIEIEKIHRPAKNVTYPRVSAGRRACPPEDSGGPYGYAEALRALRHRKGWKYQQAREIFGTAKWDPAAFDLAEVNTALGHLA